MTARTAWTGGNLNSGLGYVTAINSADMASMATAQSVVSSVSDITNGASLDIFADISFSLTISSSTIAAGANIAFWLFLLNQDGSTYGDGQFANGTAASKTPTFAPCGVFPLVAATAQTTLVGTVSGIIIPPGSFRFGMQNNSGFTLTSGTQTVKYRSYNTNLNS